jgi:hypothetical protein
MFEKSPVPVVGVFATQPFEEASKLVTSTIEPVRVMSSMARAPQTVG